MGAGFYRDVIVRIRFIQLDIGGFNGQVSALRHGVAGVDGQVHDDLFDLSRVGLHLRQRGLQGGPQLHVFADQALQHFLDIGDHGIQVQHLGRQHLLPAEGQQLPGQGRGPVSGGLWISFTNVLAVSSEASISRRSSE